MKVGLIVAYGYCVSILTIAAMKGNVGLMLLTSVALGILAAFIAKD